MKRFAGRSARKIPGKAHKVNSFFLKKVHSLLNYTLELRLRSRLRLSLSPGTHLVLTVNPGKGVRFLLNLNLNRNPIIDLWAGGLDIQCIRAITTSWNRVGSLCVIEFRVAPTQDFSHFIAIQVGNGLFV